MDGKLDISRRSFLASVGALGFSFSMQDSVLASIDPTHTKAIPVTGEKLPVIGMGSWLTFDVGDDTRLREERSQVLKEFFRMGGALIDSSPMYGSSEAVIGHCLARLTERKALFSATKVWIFSQVLGIGQMEHSERLWGVGPLDLMQIHNMLNWRAHLKTLLEWKAQGKVRYIGITTSHGLRHGELAEAMMEHPFDFVQFTYNIDDREAEKRLLPLAAERGMAVIINRPFQGGNLFDRLEGKSLPPWAAEIDCANWAQFFLKFVVSHPAVTCAIPATRRVDHMRENMGALYGRLPGPVMRKRMADYMESL